MQRRTFITLLPLALAGCMQQGPTGGPRAGAVLDNGPFGAATMRNTLSMTGQYQVDLSRRFAAEVPSMVNFAFNSATLDEEARATLRAQAHWIRQFPEVRFTVYGHTDLVGSAAYNDRLGLRRAQAVVAYLTAQGVSRSRLDAVVSKGERQPLVVTEGRERRNRRTVTDVSGFVENHPMVLNGKYAQVVFREYVRSGAPNVTMPVQSTSFDLASGGVSSN